MSPEDTIANSGAKHGADDSPVTNEKPVKKAKILAAVADEQSENLAPWADRWDKKKINFHLSAPNVMLEKHADKLFDIDSKEEKGACVDTRVFVPLCGKTLDLPYLASRSSEVVGVEGVRTALVEFAEENADMKVVVKGERDGFERFEGEKILLLKGDYFDVTPDATDGKFGAIYDRAAMVAISPELKEDYVNVFGKVLGKGGKILLVALDRQGTEEAMKRGPPFSLPESTVRSLFEGKEWVESVTLLEQNDQLETNPEDRKRYEGLDKLLQTVYLIQAMS